MDTDDTTTHAFDDELGRYLASIERDDSYRVVRTLKVSDAETTELVMFEGAGGGSLGPFVRKRIAADARIGGAYERLFRAQKAGRRFEHLPRIVDCRHAPDGLDVVMEYIEGETLAAVVRRLGPSVPLADAVMPTLCKAVGELHAGFALPGERPVPVIHRDLKPSNIMISGAGPAPAGRIAFSSLVLIDLGIAREWREGADADTVKFGTRSYAPPEQYGFGQTSARSDVYALGGLLYFCVTGVDPEPGLGPSALAEKAGVPSRIAVVIERAMAFDPAVRYGSAVQMAAALSGANEDLHEGTCKTRPAMPAAPHANLVRTSLHSLSSRVRLRLRRRVGLMDRLHRIPDGLGRAWNVLLYLALALLFWSSWLATFCPTGANVNLPTWFLALEYLFMLDIGFATTTFVMLDKRRWRLRFPVLERWRGKRLAVWYVGINAVTMLVVSVIGSGLSLI